MIRQEKAIVLLAVTIIAASCGTILACNGRYVPAIVLGILGFLCAWQALYLLTARRLP